MGETISYKFVAVKDDVEGAPKEADFELIDASVSISSMSKAQTKFLLNVSKFPLIPIN
ncbi:2-alkenal reductase (NADP(+)-dependent) [Bienertia sinuspersici]